MLPTLKYYITLLLILLVNHWSIADEVRYIQSVSPNSDVQVCRDVSIQDQPVNEQVADFFGGIFSTINWPRRWNCGNWSSFHGWFSIFSDFIVWLSYFAIPGILYFFLQKRKVPNEFRNVFWLFIAFILCCGLTHLMEVIIFWWPAYRLSTVISFLTASVSMFTVFSLFQALPITLKYKSPTDLQQIIDERTALLRQKTTELEKINEELTNFAYVAAHDLKAPLANIESLVQLLENDKIPDIKKTEVYDRIDNTIQQSKEKIEALNDVLAIRSITNQDRGVTQVPVAIDKALSSIDELIKESKTKVVIDLTSNETIQIPEAYFITIIQNLVTNAIKYKQSDQDPIIRIKSIKENKRIKISIDDNGRGIDLEKLEDKFFGLFQRFHLDVPGKGVGLYITKNLIENFNGEISIESEVGKGSTFNIYFPLR